MCVVVDSHWQWGEQARYFEKFCVLDNTIASFYVALGVSAFLERQKQVVTHAKMQCAAHRVAGRVLVVLVGLDVPGMGRMCERWTRRTAAKTRVNFCVSLVCVLILSLSRFQSLYIDGVRTNEHD